MKRLAEAIVAGDARALARAISLLEADDPRGADLLAAMRRTAAPRRAGAVGAHLIGITGSPGSGKSTLVDRLIETYRGAGRRVAVVAVDPTSPYSGGAILGDRVRMTRWFDDDGVFVRSMATRGQLGGLASATLRVAALLDAADFDVVLIETVGVGQSEVDVVEVTDSTVLVLTPAGGDGVQAFKAGVMEIADLFVINKADLPGADRLRQEIRAAQGLAPVASGAWTPPILHTTAQSGEGTAAVVDALADHARWAREHGGAAARRRRRARAELAAAVRVSTQRALARHEPELLDALLAGEITAGAAVAKVLASLDEDASEG